MAKKTTRAPMHRSWDEVDEGLRRMGEIDIAIGKLEGNMTLQINEIREKYDIKSEGLKAERAAIEESITGFAEECKDEFATTRHKDLTFGVVAYRVTRKIAFRSKAACLAALHALGLDSYIRTTEEPDKDAMAGLEPATLAKVGAQLKIEDKIRIEPNIEKIKDAA